MKKIINFLMVNIMLIPALAFCSGGSLTTEKIKEVIANGHGFSIDSGFPTTGFLGAHFSIKLNNGASPENFNWTSDQDWVGVETNGEVTINKRPEKGKEKATITATEKENSNTLTYSFSLNNWYVNDGKNVHSIASANSYCKNINYSLPGFSLLTDANTGSVGTRDVGSLWGEWGDLAAFSWPTDITYWTSDTGTEGYHYLVNMLNGLLYNDYNVGKDKGSVYVICTEAI